MPNPNKVETPTDINLAHDLVIDLTQAGLSRYDQVLQEAELAEMAQAELSPQANQIVMNGIYSRAKLRHPSMYLPGETPRSVDEQDVLREEENEIPTGFISWEKQVGGAKIDVEQFDKIIYSIASPDKILTADVEMGVTDFGKTVRICDLRPHMSRQVQKGGPKDPDLQSLLATDVRNDVLRQAQTGHGGKTVTGADKIHYSSRGRTKIRAYWMLVKDSNDTNNLTIARLADCDDSPSSQSKLYNRVFKKKI